MKVRLVAHSSMGCSGTEDADECEYSLETLGIDPEGMTKAEIVGALREALIPQIWEERAEQVEAWITDIELVDEDQA